MSCLTKLPCITGSSHYIALVSDNFENFRWKKRRPCVVISMYKRTLSRGGSKITKFDSKRQMFETFCILVNVKKTYFEKSKASTRIFSSFRSRWTRFLRCMKPKAELSWSEIFLQHDSGIPVPLTCAERSPYGAYSMAKT